MKEHIRDFAWLWERIIHKYTQVEKMPQKYCDNLLLTQPEIHTVVSIGDQEGIGVTQLAKIRGITKGAVSQMIYKLVDKGVVEKHVSPDSDAAVSLFLTDKGKQVCLEHRKRHEAQSDMFMRLMSSLSEENLLKMTEFFNSFEKELDEILSKGE
ncbi:MAG: MarR family transcriptional regulator [Treponema sp.]|nr:MarR family transcriptional regulator [Treponema sp.]